MRIWSLHPRYLDRQGLTAAWREALLAQAVLAGRTRGYMRHPQLERLRATVDPLAAVGAYLSAVADEAEARGYRFDRARIARPERADAPVPRIPVTTGQLALEWTHLAAKLTARSPADLERHAEVRAPAAHPLFVVIEGAPAPWERVTTPAVGEQLPDGPRHDPSR